MDDITSHLIEMKSQLSGISEKLNAVNEKLQDSIKNFEKHREVEFSKVEDRVDKLEMFRTKVETWGYALLALATIASAINTLMMIADRMSK